MRKIIVLTLLVLSLAACNQAEGTIEESDVTPSAAAEVAPRIEVTPTPTLPATFTPSPLTHSGHIFPVGTSSIHIIQPGDTLGELAKQYGVTVSDLARVNRITNIDRIEVGHILYIPPRD